MDGEPHASDQEPQCGSGLNRVSRGLRSGYRPLVGVVTDNTGAAVPGVDITATSLGTGVARKTTTTDQGSYTVPFLPPGEYRISAQKPPAQRSFLSRAPAKNLPEWKQIQYSDHTVSRGQLNVHPYK
jgi:hypothetical protein